MNYFINDFDVFNPGEVYYTVNSSLLLITDEMDYFEFEVGAKIEILDITRTNRYGTASINIENFFTEIHLNELYELVTIE